MQLNKRLLSKAKDLLTDNKLWVITNYHNDGALKTLRELKKVFIKPVMHFRICHPYKFGGGTCGLPWIFQFENAGIFWKDKWESPRFEGNPYGIFGPSPRISLTLFKSLRLIFWWTAPADWKDEDTYWEMWLWYKYYCEEDINKARDTWPWTDLEEDKKSTWKEEFVLPDRRNS